MNVPFDFHEAEQLRLVHLVGSREFDEATSMCIGLWADANLRRLRLPSRLAASVPKLTSQYEPARVAFVRLRDELELEPDDDDAWRRWLALSTWLGDGAAVLRWLDDMEPMSTPARKIARDEGVQRFAHEADAWASIARHVHPESICEEIDEFASQTLGGDEGSENFEWSVRSCRAALRVKFAPTRHLLIDAGRAADEAMIGEHLASVGANTTAEEASEAMQWLKEVEQDAPEVRSIHRDERLYRLAKRAGAVDLYARRIDLAHLVEDARAFATWVPVDARRHEPARWVLRAFTVRYGIACEALLRAGRVEDEAWFTAHLEALAAEVANA